MITLLTLSLMCLVAIPVLFVSMALLSIPFLIIMGILPWLLRLAAFLLLIRALLERPFHLTALLPALVIFALAALLRLV